MIALEIPTAPPSLNRLVRMHWSKRDRLGHQLRAELGLRLARHPVRLRVVASRAGAMLALSQPAVGPRIVRVVRRYRRACDLLDDDNLRGGAKPLLDALTFVGLIEDDRPGLVTVTYEQERGAGCRVEVRAPETAATAERRMTA